MVSVTARERIIDYRQAQREWNLVSPMFREILLRTDLRGKTVIDAGAGEGRLAFFLAPHVKRVVAVDVDENVLWKARQYAAIKGINNVEFLLADLEKESIHRVWDGPIDSIVSNFYMSEVLLWRASAALRVGGYFLFCCHHTDHWKETGRPTRRSFGEDEIEDLLREDFFEPEFIGVEKQIVQFPSLNEVEHFVGGRMLRRWVEDGGWDELKRRFNQGYKTLTLSYLIGKSKRGHGSHW